MAIVSQRKQIRAKLVEMLIGIEGINNNVFPNRAKKLWETEYPAIVISMKGEPAEISRAAPREYKKTVSVVIELHLRIEKDKEDPSLDDRLDDFCEIIEQRIFANETLNGLVSDTILTNTEMDHGIDGDREVAVAQLTFDCTYFVDAPAETGPLDDFGKAGMTWSEKSEADVAETPKDVVTIPT